MKTNNILKSNFAKWIWHYWTPLLIVQVVAFAAAVVFTNPYFINYQYKSSATVYPYNLTEFSKESATEQMLQFLNSVDIKNDIIRKFNLIKHYGIDTTGKYYYSKLLNEYDNNVTISGTEFEAVQITVYDRSNDTAYLMVKGIINALNKKILAIQKEKSVESMLIFKEALEIKKRELDSMYAISKQLSVQYGLVDYKNESREVVRAYYQMLASSKAGKPMDDITMQMKNLEEKGEEFDALNEHIKNSVDEYDKILISYNETLRDINKQITFTNIVAAPYPADRWSYPVRWLMIFGACLSAFVFSLVIIMLLEKPHE